MELRSHSLREQLLRQTVLYEQAMRQAANTLLDLALARHQSDGAAAVQAAHVWIDRVARERGLQLGSAPRPSYRNEKQRRRQANRRAAAQFRVVGERDGYVCRECGATRTLTVEHIIPVFLGGTDALDNLGLLCRACNEEKGIREHEEASACPLPGDTAGKDVAAAS